jgi:hypothetical protein
LATSAISARWSTAPVLVVAIVETSGAHDVLGGTQDTLPSPDGQRTTSPKLTQQERNQSLCPVLLESLAHRLSRQRVVVLLGDGQGTPLHPEDQRSLDSEQSSLAFILAVPSQMPPPPPPVQLTFAPRLCV